MWLKWVELISSHRILTGKIILLDLLTADGYLWIGGYLDICQNFARISSFCMTDGGYAGYAVAQLVEALRYKSEGRGFDSRWCHWNFSLT
jgi:hypothetical protein